MLRALSMICEEAVGGASALHAAKDVGAGVLQRDVEVLRDVVVARDGLEQARGDLVGIRVEEAQPLEAGERSERVEQIGEFHASAELRVRVRGLRRSRWCPGR